MLVTFEGTEGCGKSTLIRNLSTKLTELKIPHVVTREPGGSVVAEGIRNIILHQEMNPMTELFLYEAARVEHFEKVIRPALKSKKIVLCDRFTDSTIAYQGFARGLNLKIIEKLNLIATSSQKPAITFLLDLPVEIGLSRAQDPNKFENEGVLFQKKVRKGFLYSIKNEPKRWVKVSVEKLSPEQVCEKVLAVLLKKISGKKK